MCISVKPSQMSATKIYVGESTYKDKYVHVLAYQNKAKSNGPNAMILPIFTKEKVSEDNVIDTTDFRDFLDTISEASKHKTRSMYKGVDSLVFTASVFESGSYTIVLADSIKEAAKVLEKVPENKRPELSSEFTDSFEKLYANYPVAICCWSGDIEPEPLLWWYEPANPDMLMIPTMDSHDGKAIDQTAQVKMDHIISIGSNNEFNKGIAVKVNVPKKYQDLMPNFVKGTKIKGTFLNGDCSVSLNSLKNDKYQRIYKPYTENCGVASHMFDLNGWH